MHLPTIRTLLDYTDWSNTRLLECAANVSDDHLDQDLQIGPGTLRRILIHTYNGELVWLKRWRNEPSIPWPSESDKTPVAELATRFHDNARERNAYLDTLNPAQLPVVQAYRDSKGNPFKAPLGDMLMQAVMHSKHHQAQACNALKRLGAPWPELDYMIRLRQPV